MQPTAILMLTSPNQSNQIVFNLSGEGQAFYVVTHYNKTYIAAIYQDANNSHYKTNPTAIDIEQTEIQKGMSKKIIMKEGGGFAISLLEKI